MKLCWRVEALTLQRNTLIINDNETLKGWRLIGKYVGWRVRKFSIQRVVVVVNIVVFKKKRKLLQTFFYDNIDKSDNTDNFFTALSCHI